MHPLRPYQARAVEAMRAKFRAGSRRVLLVLPTGGGKTRTAAEVVRGAVARGSKVLWVCHRRELLDQGRAAVQAETGLPVHVVDGGDPGPNDQINIASIQTLLGTHVDADVLIVDEAHHYVSPEWNKVMQAYQGKPIVGLTATPMRGDGVGLGGLFDSMVVAAYPQDLIDQGSLVGSRFFSVPPQEEGARTTIGMHPVKAYEKFMPGRQAIVFCSNVEAAVTLAQEFSKSGIDAQAVHGEVGGDVRLDFVEKFRSKSIRVLTNVHVLTEGFDAPGTGGVILARGFSSEASYLQAVGRALRPSEGKTHGIVVDLVGKALAFGFPEDRREFSLDGKPVRGHTNEPLWTCQSCYLVFDPTTVKNRTCPFCDEVAPKRKGLRYAPKEVKEAVRAQASKHNDAQRLAFLLMHSNRLRAEGKNVWAARHLFKAKYGEFPSSLHWGQALRGK